MSALLKICGNTSEADVDTVAESAADFIGLPVVENRLSLAEAKPLIQRARENNNIRVKKGQDPQEIVLLLDSSTSEDILAAIDYCGPDYVQLNGSISLNEIKKLRATTNKGIIRTIAVDKYAERTAFQTKNYIDYIALDNRGESGILGGTGKTVDWEMAATITSRMRSYGIPVALAGGLNEDNVHLAIEQVNPNMIDISTGASAGGQKDLNIINKLAKKITA